MQNGKFSTRYLFIILLIAVLISPALAFADADKIFKENNKAVVVVKTYNEKGKPIGQGSGFIVRADGAVVTNYHVISNAVDIKVKAGDKVLDVEGLIHTDKENDLVILKVKGEKLSVVKLGDIEKANIGEKVYVISSPQGLENTISDGILSGIREITPERKILQITAPVSEGSSGGPVFNNNGEVIGIATFLVKEAQNLNFAMPVNLIKGKIGSKKIIALKDSEIEDYKKTAEYWFNLGIAYWDLGMHEEAVEAFKQAIRIKSDYAKAHYNLGVAYEQSGMHEEAVGTFKQVIKIKPDYAKAHYNLGFAYGKSGMHREAIEAYKQAIRIKPDFAEAYNNLGLTYKGLGMYKEAISALRQAIRLKPDDAVYYDNISAAYGLLDMYEEAIYASKRAIKLRPDYADAHYFLGVHYSILQRYKEAIASIIQAIKLKPDYADAHYFLGVIYIKLNDRGSALEEYKILKDLDPELANALFNLIYK